MVTSTHLFAAWRTTEKDLLNNSGETENALFKHGGCLDLMLATNREGCYEISVPLSVLHWQPQPGTLYRADIGLLRGENFGKLLVKM